MDNSFYLNLLKKERSVSKYFNVRTVVDGISFDSKREAGRYQELKLLEKGKEIKEIEVHPRFILQEMFNDYLGVRHEAIFYEADFRYWEKKQVKGRIRWLDTVEDVKGMKTDVYKLKKKLFLYKYPKFIFIEL